MAVLKQTIAVILTSKCMVSQRNFKCIFLKGDFHVYHFRWFIMFDNTSNS
jgi:hypothetical protein